MTHVQSQQTPSYLGFVEFPLTKRLLSMGYSRDTAQDTRRALAAWLSRQVCVFEEHHSKMWLPFAEAMDVVRPLTYSDLRLDAARNPVQITRRFFDNAGERRSETYRIAGDAAALGVCYMLYSDKCRASLLVAIQHNSAPIFIAHAILLLGCVDADLVKWALPSYGSVNVAGLTAIDVRGLDVLMGMSSDPSAHESRDASSSAASAVVASSSSSVVVTTTTLTPSLYRDNIAFVMYARLIFNFVFAQMCSQKNGVTDSAIRVRLVHERTLFHMFCRHLSRTPRLTAVDVARVVPGVCADVVSHLRLPQLNELMAAAAERVIQTFDRNVSECEQRVSRRASADVPAAHTAGGSLARTPSHSAADQLVALWCSDRVAYDVFLRCRFASHLYNNTSNDPQWRAVCRTPRERRVSLAAVQLHTIGSAMAQLTRSADTSGLYRVFTFLKNKFDHPSSNAVLAELSGCSQYELFQSVARVVPASDAGFWTAFASETCVVDLGVANTDGAGVLIVCSDATFTRLEALLVVGTTMRDSSEIAPPECLESFSVSYHVARAMICSDEDPTHVTIVAPPVSEDREWDAQPSHASALSMGLWRAIVSWAKPQVLHESHETRVDWVRLDWLVRQYCRIVSQQYQDNVQELGTFFDSKSRSKFQFLLVAHASGLIEAAFRSPAHRAFVLKLAAEVVSLKTEAWCREHGLMAFVNAMVTGTQDLVRDENLVTDLLFVALHPDRVLVDLCQRTLGADPLRMLSSILSLNNASVLDDGNKVGVPYGEHSRLQHMTVVATLPSTPTHVASQSAHAFDRVNSFSFESVRDDDGKSFNTCRSARVHTHSDIVMFSGTTTPSHGRGIRDADIQHLILLDVLLTWENVFRQRTANAPRIGGVATACFSIHDAVVNLQWRQFLTRYMYDIPYGISSSGLLFSRSQLPITQFVNRKVIFSDDMRAKLLCVADTPWRNIPGFAAWWDLADLQSAYTRRHLPPMHYPRLTSRGAARLSPTAATPRRLTGTSATPYSPMYSPHVTTYYADSASTYSPTSPRPSGALEFNLFDDDSDSSESDAADDDMAYAMQSFNQYGSHQRSYNTP